MCLKWLPSKTDRFYIMDCASMLIMTVKGGVFWRGQLHMYDCSFSVKMFNHNVYNNLHGS